MPKTEHLCQYPMDLSNQIYPVCSLFFFFSLSLSRLNSLHRDSHAGQSSQTTHIFIVWQNGARWIIQRALLSFSLQDLIDKDLKQWYENYVTALSNGTLTELQKDYFKDALNEIYKKGMEIRDNIADFTGYNNYTQQGGDSGGFEAMPQDTKELSGRFTMLQITAQNIHIDVLSLLNKMDTSIAISTVRNTLLQEVVTIMNRSTSYLEDIAADTRRIRNEFGEKIDEMNTRLRVIAG